MVCAMVVLDFYWNLNNNNSTRKPLLLRLAEVVDNKINDQVVISGGDRLQVAHILKVIE